MLVFYFTSCCLLLPLINGFFHRVIHLTRSEQKQFVLQSVKLPQYDGTFELNRVIKAGFPQAYFASTKKENYDHPSRRRPQYDSPIIVIPKFLSDAECNEIIRVGKELEEKGIVADLYLNHRLNKDIASGNRSIEALKLIQEQNLSEEELAADSPSGFRAAIPPQVLLSGQPLTDGLPRGSLIIPPDGSIGEKLLALLG